MKYTCSDKGIFVHIFLWGILFLSIILPVAGLLKKALHRGAEIFIEAWEQLSSTIIPSVGTALSAAFIISLVGIWVSYYSTSVDKKITRTLLMLGFAIPSTVWGLSLIDYYNSSLGGYIYDSIGILLIAYLGRFGFIAYRIIENRFKQISPSLYEAAVLSGASWLRRFIFIEVPMILPAFSSAFILSYILAFRELGASIMVYPPGMELMPVKLYTISANAPANLTAAMTLWMLIVLLVTTGSMTVISHVLLKKYPVENY
jgi:iron(III) transport system permease protein